MKYVEALEKLRNDEMILVKGIWCFYGSSMNCYDGCCDTTFDSLEEAAESVESYSE